ncbi:MAG: FtsX-like permease family protein [Candidatus Aminicenantes bacterium]|nr:FtsX-like permease family protein [Candidatus Aminicenantes bacterium]
MRRIDIAAWVTRTVDERIASLNQDVTDERGRLHASGYDVAKESFDAWSNEGVGVDDPFASAHWTWENRVGHCQENAHMAFHLLMMAGESGEEIGKRFAFSGRPGLKVFQGTIVGVMKDFHYRRLQSEIGPLALFAAPEAVTYAVLRLPAGDIPASLATVRSTWRKVFPDAPFEYTFFEEDFDRMFKADERLEKLVGSASLLAVLISCLGLFGLASFMVEQRAREIGIRKVLGALAKGIALLLSREFFAWIMVANLLACPVAYILADKWLASYPYKIPIPGWVFGLGILLTLAMALLAVGGQTLRAARANPVQSIKYE